MLRVDNADKWSAAYLRLVDSVARKSECAENLYAHEGFPYIRWVGEVIRKRLPKDVYEFYKCVWETRESKTFFNFCKMQLASKDERSAAEVYSAESLSRYISGMIYALFISILLWLTNLLSYWIAMRSVDSLSIVLFLAYTLSLLGILKNFRFMRIKEVQTVVYASYANEELFTAFCEERKGHEGGA